MFCDILGNVVKV